MRYDDCTEAGRIHSTPVKISTMIWPTSSANSSSACSRLCSLCCSDGCHEVLAA